MSGPKDSYEHESLKRKEKEQELEPKEQDSCFLRPQMEQISDEGSFTISDFPTKYKQISPTSKLKFFTSDPAHQKIREEKTLHTVNTGDPRTPFDGTVDIEEQKQQAQDHESVKEVPTPTDINNHGLFQGHRSVQQRDSKGNHEDSSDNDNDNENVSEDGSAEVENNEENRVFKAYSKKNGFTSCPPHILQISGYISVLYLAYVFSFIVLERTPKAAAIPVGIIYYLELLILAFLTIWASWIDPTVQSSIDQINARANKTPYPETNQFEFFCNWCQVSVDDNVKHCRTCGRDVYRFDHHCWWLNNCIGAPNYHVFVKLIITCSAFLLTSSLTSLGFLIGEMLERTSSNAELSMGSVAFGMAFLFWLLITKLIHFHYYLHKRKMTTYEYVMEKRAKKNQKNKSEMSNKGKKKRGPNPEKNILKESLKITNPNSYTERTQPKPSKSQNSSKNPSEIERYSFIQMWMKR